MNTGGIDPAHAFRRILVTLEGSAVSHLGVRRGCRKMERSDMKEFVQVWRAKVADADVEPLLAVRPAAIEEAKHLCPELVGAKLVDAGGGVWLDVLTWSVADGEERLMAKAESFDALQRMHGYLESAEQIGRGPVATSG